MVKRGLLAGLLLLVLGAMQQAPHSPAVAATSIQGDVNCGGTVTAVDALQVLRSVAGLSTTAGCLAEAGDSNCSGKIDAVDALRVLRYGLTMFWAIYLWPMLFVRIGLGSRAVDSPANA